MKLLNVVSVVLVGVSSLSAYAGQGGCLTPATVLKCESSYSLKSGYQPNVIAGPQAEEEVQDISPEPFDLSECSASVVLFTYVGRFVATYSETSKSLYVWLETDGKTQVLTNAPFSSAAGPSVLKVSSSLKGIVDTATFKCSVSK